MKNTLYFDNQLNLRLLSNEENDLNTVWIDIETDSSANQTLQILLNGSTTSIALDSSSANDVELPAALWANGGDTLFRLVNSSFTSEYQTITFPEILTTDAALYEVSTGAYKLQGQQKDDASAYATQVIAYTNARAYEVGTTQIRVISVDFTCSNENTSGVFGCTIVCETSGITDTAIITARIMHNREFDEVFVPIQTVENGKHIITIHYPLTEILALTSNNVSVFLSIDDGTIDIEQGAIRASVLAAGLTSGEPAWDGRIDIDESWEENITILAMTFDKESVDDASEFDVYVPTKIVASETYTDISMPSMTVETISDSVTVAFVVYSAIIDSTSTVVRDATYTTINSGNFVLKTNYLAASVTETIDSGYCTKVTPFVTGLTVSDVEIV